ncbi:UNVERIFIED_CONTAM: hypothetical protein FKN15_029479 [Acipenser sinensis]
MKYPLRWIHQIQTRKLYPSHGTAGRWFLLLDVGCSQLDLQAYPANFVPISIYTIFGFPTGLGALLVHNDSSGILQVEQQLLTWLEKTYCPRNVHIEQNLLNPIIFLECVSFSPLSGTLPSSVDDAVTLYNTTLTQIIDTIAPLTTISVKKHRNCPWYTLKLRLLKSTCRKFEHKRRLSGLTIHREIWIDHLSGYRCVLAAARLIYFSEIISMGHGKPNILFKTIDQIMHPAADKSIFQNKIDTIYSMLSCHTPSIVLDHLDSPPFAPPPLSSLHY